MAEECANPLFAEWLKDWWDAERERNTKAHIVYRKAYQSMKACPTPFQHASQAETLNGIGPKMIRRLEDKHNTYCLENGLPQPKKPGRKDRITAADSLSVAEGDEVAEERPAKRQKTKEYVPQLRSGAYAIIKILGQLDQNSSQSLSKKELQDRAQPHCDSSFTIASDPSKYYTAWKSMETLLKKELVYTRGHPLKKYQLTDEGWRTALKMQAHERGEKAQAPKKQLKSKNVGNGSASAASSSLSNPSESAQHKPVEVLDLSSDSEVETHHSQTPLPKLIPIRDSGTSASRAFSTNLPPGDPIVLEPGSFEVELVLDNREIRSKSDRDFISIELRNKYAVNAEVRPLPLGDVLWIAKLKSPHDTAFKLRNAGDDDEGSTEIVLEHIIERKRLDDLIHSLRDGRFHEQKFRLKKSGIRHVTYLIETIALSAERQEANAQAIESTISQMQVVDDIFVKQTKNIGETIQYLARVTKALKLKYERQKLHVLPSQSLDIATHYNTLYELRDKASNNVYGTTFSAFCSLCDKSDSLTLRDIYLRMLMCIHGVTGDKAIEIQKIWPTPHVLTEAYRNIGNDAAARESLISDQLGKKIDRKRVTKILSAKIAAMWCD